MKLPERRLCCLLMGPCAVLDPFTRELVLKAVADVREDLPIQRLFLMLLQ